MQFLDFKLVLGIQYCSKLQDVCVCAKNTFARVSRYCIRVDGTNIVHCY